MYIYDNDISWNVQKEKILLKRCTKLRKVESTKTHRTLGAKSINHLHKNMSQIIGILFPISFRHKSYENS